MNKLLRKEELQETENKNNCLVQGRYPSTILYNIVQLVTDKQVICSQLMSSEMLHCGAE
jgi:hypothetical protein